jgi:hypothetical protein
MAHKIFFEGYRDTVDTPFVKYEARNLQNFDFNVNIPVTTFGLPEFYLEGAILTKAEGNTGKFVFSWVIKDEITTPFTTKLTWDVILDDVSEDVFFPNSVAWTGTNSGDDYTSRRNLQVGSNSTYQAYDTKTSDGQVVALSEYFEKKGFSSSERHKFVILDETNNKYLFNQEGTITRMSFQKSGTDPVTWNASLEFAIGDVVDSGE